MSNNILIVPSQSSLQFSGSVSSSIELKAQDDGTLQFIGRDGFPLITAGPNSTDGVIFYSSSIVDDQIIDGDLTVSGSATVTGTGDATLNIISDNDSDYAAARNTIAFKSNGGTNVSRIQWDESSATLNLGYGANDHLTINSSGNVGIGTTSPDYLLHISESTGATAGWMQISAASYGNALFGMDASGFRLQSDSDIYFNTNGGTTALTVSSNQTVTGSAPWRTSGQILSYSSTNVGGFRTNQGRAWDQRALRADVTGSEVFRVWVRDSVQIVDVSTVDSSYTLRFNSGNSLEALRLTSAQNAEFSGNVTVDDGAATLLTLQRNGGTDANSTIAIPQTSATWYFGASSGNRFAIKEGSADLAVSPLFDIDTSGNATFAGNITTTGVGRFGTGTVSTPSIAFNGDTNTGFYNYTNNQIGASAGGTLIQRWTGASTEITGNTSITGTLGVSGNITGNSGAITSITSSTSTNDAVFGVGYQATNTSATDGNHSTYGFYNSNSLVTSQIIGKHVSHASRHGQIQLMTHNGTSLLTGYTLDKDQNSTFAGDVTLSGGDLGVTGNVTITDSNVEQFWIETGVTADNSTWGIAVNAEVFNMKVLNDAKSAGANFMSVQRTANNIDSITWVADSHVFDTGNVTLSTGDLTIGGNLVVLGDTIEAQISELRIEDKLITLASGSVNGAASDGAGFEIDRGSDPTVALTWENTNDRFKFNKGLVVSGSLVTTGTGTFAGLTSTGTALFQTNTGGSSKNIQISNVESSATYEIRVGGSGSSLGAGVLAITDLNAANALLKLDASGNLTTNGANVYLDKAGNATGTILSFRLTDSGNSISAGNEFGTINFEHNDAQGNGIRARIVAEGDGTSGESALKFYTAGSGGFGGFGVDNTTLALTLDSSQNATFAGNLTLSSGVFSQVVSDATNNGVTTVASFSHLTSGTSVNGIGTRLAFLSEDDSGVTSTMGYLNYTLTDVTDGAEKSQIGFWTRNGGSITEKVTIGSTGDVTLSSGDLEVTSGNISGSASSTGSFGSVHVADKIGIGTTAPSGSSLLSVIGGSAAVGRNIGSVNREMLRLYDTGATRGDWSFVIGASHALKLQPNTTDGSNAWFVIEDLDGTDTVAINTDTKQIRLDPEASGSVLVGTTTDTYGQFQVLGESLFGVNLSNSIYTYSGGLNAGYSTNGEYNFWLNYRGYQNGTTQFRDLVIGDGKQNEIVRFDGSTGNVGIGTSTPTSSLHINESGTGDLFPLVVQNAIATAVGAGVGIEFQQGVTGSAGYILSDRESNYGGLESQADSALAFATAINDVNTERMRITSAGYVGIGTNTPETWLHVSASGGSGGITIQNDGTNDAFMRFKTSTETWIVANDGNGNVNQDALLIYWGNGTDLHTAFDNSGNVGIGTSTPSERLHIKDTSSTIILESTGSSGRDWRLGSTDAGSGAGGGKFVIRDHTAGAWRFIIDSAGSASFGTTVAEAGYRVNIDGGLYVSSSIGGASVFKVEGTSGSLFEVVDTFDGTLMSVNDSSGVPIFNVSSSGQIGINQPNPTYDLDVNGSGSFEWLNVNGNLNVVGDFTVDDISSDTGSFGYLDVSGNSVLTGTLTSGAHTITGAVVASGIIRTTDGRFESNQDVGGIDTHFRATRGSTKWQLQTLDSDEFNIEVAGTDRYTISTAGVHTITGTLGVSGDGTFGGNLAVSNTQPKIRLFETDATVDENAEILVSAGDLYIRKIQDNATALGNVLKIDLTTAVVTTYGGLTLSSGNISGSASSTASFGTYIGDGSQLTGIAASGPGGIFAATGSVYSTTNDLQITGSLLVTGTITEQSTRKVKDNIKYLYSELYKVKQLEPVSYTKKGSDVEEIGLLAEDVAKIYPEIVTYDLNGDPNGIQYTRLSVLLLQAINELNEKIDKLHG